MSAGKKKQLVYFSQEQIALQQELVYHQKILDGIVIDGVDTKSFPEIVAYVAGTFNIIVDGFYTYNELRHLATVLTTKLRDTRSIIIQ